MMESKCFRVFLNKFFYLINFIIILLTTDLVANNIADIQNDQIKKVTIKSKQLYIKYAQFPKNIYTQQRFNVNLEARILVPKKEYDYIDTSYINSNSIGLLNSSIAWTEKENNLFVTQISYKVTDQNFTLPKIKLALIKEKKEINSIILNPPKIKYNDIALNQKQFSNIIASNLEINSIKTKQYTNKMLMVVLNIKAIDSNLEEFRLKQFEDQGINSFVEENNAQRMYYYVIIPSYIDNIKFDYYNPISATFVGVELPIMLEDDLVSTQTDLNPQDNNMLYYKQITIIVLFLLFALGYLKTKNKIILIFSIVFLIIIIKLFMPNKIITLKPDTKVYILPTSSSTVYKILSKNNNVEILLEKDNFIKVLFKNKHIGWIKENDIK